MKLSEYVLSGGERWRDAEGYIIAYQVVRNLLQEDEIELEMSMCYDLTVINKSVVVLYCT